MKSRTLVGTTPFSISLSITVLGITTNGRPASMAPHASSTTSAGSRIGSSGADLAPSNMPVRT
jgi:hypothetical protein